MVYCIWYIIYCIWRKVYGICHMVHGMWYMGCGVWHMVHDIWYTVWYRRLGGRERQLTPIGKSVSVSFRVRVVRACVRAKLCGGASEVSSSTLGARTATNRTPAWGGSYEFLLVYAWVLRIFFNSCCYMHGFYGLISQSIAICMGFMD